MNRTIQKFTSSTLSRTSVSVPTKPVLHIQRFSGFRKHGLGLPKAVPATSRASCILATGRARSGRTNRLVVHALFEKFTERSIKSVMLAQEWTRSGGGSEVTPQHILLGLIGEDSSKPGFMNSTITVENARNVFESIHERQQNGRRQSPKDLPFSHESKRLFEAALLESRRMSMSFIAPEHILLAILSCSDSDLAVLLHELGAQPEQLRAEALRRLRGEAESEGARRKVSASPSAPRSAGKDGPKALDEFCRDLCAEAAANRTDPVIGRTKEVARVAQILARRTKNNPILLGEPGVGKTAVAEGLARAIVTRVLPDGAALPEFLANKRVLQLDVGLLIAGAKERGELESRVTRLLAETQEDGNVILMIDEVHTLVGAGAVGRGGGGGLDIANLLKPALARGRLQCIGATTLDEHRKHIERDAALERRFQPVMIGEPTEEESLQILEGLVDRYERHHRVIYSSDALEAAVLLSSRYVADRHLPDKAIDLLDEAGSRVRIAAYNARRDAGGDASEVAAVSYGELSQVIETKDEAAKDALFEEAALLRARELELKAKLSGEPESAPVVPVVSELHIQAVVSAWTGVPVETMGADEKERLRGLGDALRGRVIGQDEAVDTTARAVARAAAGLKNPRRPIAALLFSGPTGVGKTELAKALAEGHFGAADAAHAPLIRLDMSEYMERHTVSKLIGAPPGYVGYGEGGKLTEAVRRRPFSLVLFDEIEKAHPDVFNVLLQVLEDGRLTDAQGRVVSFKNALIVLTTNVGSSVLARGGGSIGFELPDADGQGAEAARRSRMRGLVMEELKNYFRPELLNRLDEVVVFNRLSRSDVAAIAQLELAKTAERMAERGLGMRVTSSVMDLILEEGYSEAMGARELRRAVTRIVDDALSDAMLHGKVKPGEVVVLRRSKSGSVEAATLAEAAADTEATAVAYERA